MNDYPFTENLIKDNVFLREFKEDTNESELVWHQDQEERILTVVKSNNWKLQMDNELPITLQEGQKYSIPAYFYHRVIKGEGDLVIVVEKKVKN